MKQLTHYFIMNNCFIKILLIFLIENKSSVIIAHLPCQYKYKIALVCDFFYPLQGGVEIHLYQLALTLIRKGCKVIMITHYYNDRQGIRYMGNGLKV